MAELSAVAVLVLGLLHEQPMHPYQLHQTLVERGDTRIVRVNPGAVYHGVERLERHGLVEVVGTDRTGRRPERTTYRLTDAGRDEFAARLTSLLGDEHPTYPLFSVGLAEANELPSDQVLTQLVRRRDRKVAHRDHLAASYDTVSAMGLPRRFLLDVDHDLATLRAEIDWLDRTITDLRTGALDWAGPIPDSFHDAKSAHRATPSTPPQKDIS